MTLKGGTGSTMKCPCLLQFVVRARHKCIRTSVKVFPGKNGEDYRNYSQNAVAEEAVENGDD